MPASLPEDLSLAASTHVRQFTTTYNSNSGRYGALFWPPQALHRPIHRHTNIIKNKTDFRKKFKHCEMRAIPINPYLPIHTHTIHMHILNLCGLSGLHTNAGICLLGYCLSHHNFIISSDTYHPSFFLLK